MDHTEATGRLLDAAEDLFYAHGVQAVGMDAVRAKSGVSLKRLYQCFPSKDLLVEAYLLRRDKRWRGSLESFVSAHGDDPLAVFDWLREWFSEPDFRGCAFVNTFGELGNPTSGIAAAIRDHKEKLRLYLRRLVENRLVEDHSLAEQLLTLVEGATVLAAISGDPGSASTSREAAAALMETARRETARQKRN